MYNIFYFNKERLIELIFEGYGVMWRLKDFELVIYIFIFVYKCKNICVLVIVLGIEK